MEDEVIQTATEPVSDVVETNVTSTVAEPVVDPSQSAAVTQPVMPAPLTDRELAVQEINNRQVNSYSTKGQGIKNWIATDYNYDATQAGTLWVAGKINDANTQMSFLEATLNEDLYSEMDLQKYFFDTNLATARAYAKEKKHETAYGFYRAAEEKALAEAQLTGWYMPAEAGYMLSQWILADEQLKDPNISAVDKARAESVSRAASGWFEANNITERGIRCLNSLYLQETIRHNKEMERLQADANDIQRLTNEAQNKANAGNYKIQLAEFKFQLAEEELGTGFDLDDDGIIGHTGEDAQRFGYYTSEKDWAMNNMGKAMSYWGSDRTREVLGNDYFTAQDSYQYQVQNNVWFKEQAANNYIDGANMSNFTGIKLQNSELKKIDDKIAGVNDATIKMIRDGNGQVRLYVFNKDGMAYQITDGNLKLTNGTTINDLLKKQRLTLNTNIDYTLTGKNTSGEQITLNIGKSNYGKYSFLPNLDNKEMYPGFTEKGLKSFEKLRTEKGFKLERGLVDTKGTKELVLSDTDANGDVTYYSFNSDTGAYKKITDTSSIVEVTYTDGVYSVNYYLSGRERDRWAENFVDPNSAIIQTAISNSEIIIGKTDKGEDIYVYVNHDGTTSKPYTSREVFYSHGFDPSRQIKFNYLSDDEIQNLDLTKIQKSLEAYANNIPEQETIKTGTPEDIAKEIEESTTKEEKESIEKEIASIKTSDVNVRQLSNNKSESKKNSDSVKTQFKEDTVITDHGKYVTAFAEGEAVKQIQEIDEKFRQQLGATYL